jgi:hypothetical protein
MKINENFLLSEVAGNAVVMPVGEAADRLNGMLKLNDTGAFLFRTLQAGTTEAGLTDALCTAYEVDRDTAARDVAAFLHILRTAGILDE